MTISGRLALRRIFSRNSLALMALCLCVIMVSVLLMNFERPRAAVINSSTHTSSTTPDVPPEQKQPAQAKELPGAGTSVPTPLSAHSVIPDSDPTKSIKGLLIPVYGV